ncbi:TPA: homoserine kinase, partial [Streptococcus agalactiae]
MRIIVPATSANIGPGFDSIGVALSKYLSIEVLEESTEWLVEHNLVNIPKDHTNLLIQTALHVKSDLAPHRLKMFSDIPLARGLGSSSSVIVAGIELANQLGNLALSQKEKLEIATRLEGHPDNVAPAIFGDLVISSIVKNDIKSLEVMFPDSSFIAFIPNYELKTSDSRNVL